MKISIIVPVYNSARYLTACIKSLLDQTYKNYEIILIDDRSTDESLQICNNWAKDNPLISVIHLQKNGGVSRARNIGLKYARGEYVTFVDSDDYISNDFIENLVNPLYMACYDMVFSGAIYFRREGEICYEVSVKAQEWYVENKCDLLDFMQQPLITSPWAKLYKREIIENGCLKFDEELFLGEDRDFNIEYISKIKSVCSLAYNGYFYRRDVADSLTRRKHEGLLKNDLIYWNKLHNLLADVGLDYQEHRLFYIIVDNFFLINKRVGLVKAWMELREVSYLIDGKFLKSNIQRIAAPLWIKFFLFVFL